MGFQKPRRPRESFQSARPDAAVLDSDRFSSLPPGNYVIYSGVYTDRRSAETALGIVLDTTRTGRWSVGLGVGDIRMPLPDAARKATGTAFVAAREAVNAAKRADGRFALRAGSPVSPTAAGDVEALVRLLVLLRERRSDHGWEVVELMRSGHQQKEAASLLDVSAAAVSARLKAAMWRAEEDARPALVRLLQQLETESERAAPE